MKDKDGKGWIEKYKKNSNRGEEAIYAWSTGWINILQSKSGIVCNATKLPTEYWSPK